MGKLSNRRKKNKRQLLIFVIVLLFVGVAWAQYESWFERRALVGGHFANPDGTKSAKFSFEVAHTPDQRSRGLMYRQSMDADQGMIFVFPYATKQTFWMRNTLISLDMLFLDEDLKLVGLLENVPINNDEKRAVDKDSLYVVELVAGAAKKQGITVGSVLTLDQKLPDPVK
ncbi:MAG: DUF192 domain-containing protein [Bdellovibrionales bacterium]|nr:DUF192 domain-containing protein [Bdellovibrionales bacterium]